MENDIVKKTMELGLALQETNTYRVLDNARKLNDADEELQQAIGEFNLARMDLNNELSKGADKSEDKINDLNDKITDLYRSIMENDSMTSYNMARNQMDSLMQYLTDILTAAVNGEDPTKVEQSASGCTGSCSSCGGCH